jgi:hypothetical protein
MSENSGNGSFWTSLSGILTALAALVTAGLGVWAAMHATQAQQKTVNPQQPPPISSPQQSPPRSVHPEPTGLRVVDVALRVDPFNYTGHCPVTLNFSGRIEVVGGPGVVSYKFLRSDASDAPVQSASFTGTGNQNVSTTWTQFASSSGWQQIQVLDPGNAASERASFTVQCR